MPPPACAHGGRRRPGRGSNSRTVGEGRGTRRVRIARARDQGFPVPKGLCLPQQNATPPVPVERASHLPTRQAQQEPSRLTLLLQEKQEPSHQLFSPRQVQEVVVPLVKLLPESALVRVIPRVG